MSKRPFQPSRESVRGDELEYYDRVIARQNTYGYGREKGTEAGPHFGYLLQAPYVADALCELGAYYRGRGATEGSFSHAHREWADHVIGKEISLAIFWSHMLDGVASGLRIEAIKALWEGRDWDLNREELMLTIYIRQVVNGTVTQQSYDAIEDLLGVRGVVEYSAWICHLQTTARLMSAHNPDMFRDIRGAIEERLKAIMDGTAELPPGPRVPSKL